MKVAEQLHDAAARPPAIDVLLDDRDCRAGVKFKDADLIGFPLRVVIGERGLKEGKLEIKWRWDEKPEMIDLAGAAEEIAGVIRQERATGDASPPGAMSYQLSAFSYQPRSLNADG